MPERVGVLLPLSIDRSEMSPLFNEPRHANPREVLATRKSPRRPTPVRPLEAASAQDPTAVARAGRELLLTRVALLVTAVVTAVIGVQMVRSFLADVGHGGLGAVLSGLVFNAAVLALIYGGVVYQVARLGRFSREVAGPRPTQDVAALFAPGAAPGALTVLVPSYREDLSVVRQTVLSAALQEYPDRRVVVCVDNPPDALGATEQSALTATRMLPAQTAALLRAPAQRAAAAEQGFFQRQGSGAGRDVAEEARRLASEFRRAARWLDVQAAREPRETPTDRLFVDRTFTRRATACRAVASDLLAQAAAGSLGQSAVAGAYARLASLFRVEVATFERKRYVNTSHEPNKAMNLNSYIGLIGGTYREVERPDGLHLERLGTTSGSAAVGEPASLSIPEATWLLTVDADSLLVHDYAPRMVGLMLQPEHARTAVCQTPYSAVPGLTGRLERTAGATTDIMYLLHQGSTRFDAAFWVGANAMLRVAALRDIATIGVERGHEVRRFIQDRTVIEDTESTVDLVDAGWSLHNYPARLAYSATPPDYGSLLIQRRRWANGGLLILPKLLRSYRDHGLRGRVTQLFLRMHYLISIATVNVALLVLMSLPPEAPAYWLLLPLVCLPYFALYAHDLRLIGRRRRDLIGIYALNLLLVPVNLGGVLKSVQQAVTGEGIAFGRTPKVSARTAAPRLYVALTLLLLLQWVGGAVLDVLQDRWVHGLIGGLNAAILAAAITCYVGWRNALADLTRRPVTAAASTPPIARSTQSSPGFGAGQAPEHPSLDAHREVAA